MSAALIVFAKAPVAGHAKTRLIPALGTAAAAALAEQLLEYAMRAATAARFDHLELCVTPDVGHPAFRRLASGDDRLTVSTQGDGDLGARMDRALTRALSTHERAILIGTDAPALDAGRLVGAREALIGLDAVFVPALDGGYALVGLARPAPTLFADVDWGSAQVMTQTRLRAGAAGLRWRELEPVADIDEPEDLVHLPAAWPARRAWSARREAATGPRDNVFASD
ncbi:MAG: TIGR04282 family arsenosugar biosynthesis glycosyltransferase [Pseudomonadota bacterium]|nr:TIGR04282 family arsenosugar biosynthesis glycosyltransferase [Pseudomonadota bacterium]